MQNFASLHFAKYLIARLTIFPNFPRLEKADFLCKNKIIKGLSNFFKIMGKSQRLKEKRMAEEGKTLLEKRGKNKKTKKLLAVFCFLCLAFLIGYMAIDSFSNKEAKDEDSQKPAEESSEKIFVLETNLGIIKIKMFSDAAPKTVENFEKLAGEGFYDGVRFHRVIKDFMLQTGDPNSKDNDWSNDGTGGPGYAFDDEINDYKIIKGRIAMANSGPNTNGSQFFIVTKEAAPWLDGKHTVFGEVVEGMDVVDKIEGAETNENDHPLKDITISKISLEEK